jgi:hypothetical protein
MPNELSTNTRIELEYEKDRQKKKDEADAKERANASQREITQDEIDNIKKNNSILTNQFGGKGPTNNVLRTDTSTSKIINSIPGAMPTFKTQSSFQSSIQRSNLTLKKLKAASSSSSGSTSTGLGSTQINDSSTEETTINEYSEITRDVYWEDDNYFSSAEDAEASGWKISAGAGQYSSNNASKAMTESINGIFGIPYQFPKNVDPLVDGTEVGRKYMEKILSVMPVLFLTPGEPVFMAGLGKKAKAGMINKVINALGGDHDNDDDPELDGDGRYYSFAPTFMEYQRYANTALRALAIYMGIGNRRIPTDNGHMVKLSNIRVDQLVSSDFKKLFGSNSVIPFYIDAETSISENFNNDTTESIVSQAANQGSDMVRQLKFVLGSHDIGGGLGMITKAIQGIGATTAGAADTLATGIGNLVVGSGLMTRLKNELTTVVTGGKIIFPEIWNSSSYSRSYSITQKLRSPDPDPVSIFMNIYVPIILWISAAAPRQISNSSNSYKAPFLVRATYKSIFNCDLGLISSLSISKGGEDKWNGMGMPMTAEITVDIKDLYSTMQISKSQGLLNNTAQMDYLALMAGIDMNVLEPARMVNLATKLYMNKVTDFVPNVWGSVKESLNRRASSFLENTFNIKY